MLRFAAFFVSLLAAFLVALGAAAPVRAQWTLPEGTFVVGAQYELQFADSEFFNLNPGEPVAERRFPLDGRFYGNTITAQARLGLTNDFEVALEVPFRIVTYTSDPVVLLSQPAGSMQSSLDFFQENVINLGQTTAGIGDIQVAARYRWVARPFPFTTEVRLKLPALYDGPAGTFGLNPESPEQFAANIETFTQPGNVTDDVTLGDAQVDIALRQLFGASFPSGTFVAGDVGYNLRLAGAADQVVASLRMGQLLAGTVLLFAGGSLSISVEDGKSIGVSVAAEDPLLPAEDYGGTTNLDVRPIRLLRDYIDAYGGMIIRLSNDLELKLAYGRIIWGRNVSATNSFTVSVGGRTQLFGPG